MFVTDTEEANGSGDSVLAIYWIGDNDNPRQFGVCFSGAYFNIARQSVAESIPLAMDVADAAINSLESPKRSAWVVVDNRHAPDLLINSIVYSGRESAEAEAKRQRIGRGCDDRPESIAAKEMMYV